jgi:hypothetical protein
LTQSEIADNPAAPDGRSRRGWNHAITPGERGSIYALALAGLSKAEIARRLGRGRKTVAAVPTDEEFEQVALIAKDRLRQHPTDFADD